MAPQKKRLGEALVDAGVITVDQLRIALERQKSWGDRLGANLIITGALTESDLQLFFAKKTGIKELQLDKIRIPREIATMIPYRVAEQFNLIPVKIESKNTLIVACADPTDLNALDQVAFITGHKVIPVISSYSDIVQAINRYMLGYGLGQDLDEPEIEGDSDLEKAEDVDITDSQTLDPDIIVFDGNHRFTKSAQPTKKAPPENQPVAVAQPEQEEESGVSLDEELGFDFGRPLLKYSAEEEKAAVGPDLDSNQFTFDQKMRAFYQVMLRKGLVSEQEINSELMRMWSLGQLK